MFSLSLFSEDMLLLYSSSAVWVCHFLKVFLFLLKVWKHLKCWDLTGNLKLLALSSVHVGQLQYILLFVNILLGDICLWNKHIFIWGLKTFKCSHFVMLFSFPCSFLYLVLRSLNNYFVHVRVIQMYVWFILDIRDGCCFVFDAFCL